jgi:hypothetical protein
MLPVAALALLTGCVPSDFGSPGFYCDDAMGQTCPAGESCLGGQCVKNVTSSSSTLTAPPKSATYMGTMTDPGLDNINDCPDKMLEPNDTLKTSVDTSSLNISPDGSAHGLQNLAICPTGKNPLANDGHDVDIYQLEVTESVGAVVELTYNVQQGDLDVGIYGSTGSLIKGDGSAVSNACVATPLSAGTYFIGVFGANNTDSNRYTMSIAEYTSTSMACPTGQ